jgi:hypothetical protein
MLGYKTGARTWAYHSEMTREEKGLRNKSGTREINTPVGHASKYLL